MWSFPSREISKSNNNVGKNRKESRLLSTQKMAPLLLNESKMRKQQPLTSRIGCRVGFIGNAARWNCTLSQSHASNKLPKRGIVRSAGSLGVDHCLLLLYTLLLKSLKLHASKINIRTWNYTIMHDRYCQTCWNKSRNNTVESMIWTEHFIASMFRSMPRLSWFLRIHSYIVRTFLWTVVEGKVADRTQQPFWDAYFSRWAGICRSRVNCSWESNTSNHKINLGDTNWGQSNGKGFRNSEP